MKDTTNKDKKVQRRKYLPHIYRRHSTSNKQRAHINKLEKDSLRAETRGYEQAIHGRKANDS